MQLTIEKQVKINGKEIILINYNNDIFISDKDIGRLYDIPCRNIRRKIKDVFQKNIDYINLKDKMFCDEVIILMQLGYNQLEVSRSSNIYLFSLTGYIKLIKFMDKCWYKEYQYIYYELLNNCFTQKHNVSSNKKDSRQNKKINYKNNLLLKIKDSEDVDEKTILVMQYLENIPILYINNYILLPEKIVEILHKTKSCDIRAIMKKNKFSETIDYIDIIHHVSINNIYNNLLEQGYPYSLTSLKHIYCFTEKGYRKLFNFLKDDNIDIYVFGSLLSKYFNTALLK